MRRNLRECEHGVKPQIQPRFQINDFHFRFSLGAEPLPAPDSQEVGMKPRRSTDAVISPPGGHPDSLRTSFLPMLSAVQLSSHPRLAAGIQGGSRALSGCCEQPDYW